MSGIYKTLFECITVMKRNLYDRHLVLSASNVNKYYNHSMQILTTLTFSLSNALRTKIDVANGLCKRDYCLHTDQSQMEGC